MDIVSTQREIEFRGYCDYKKQWEYGGFAKINDDVFIVAKCDFFKVTPESVGQYTGLKDKHGNKIFEGDILRTRNTSIFIVEWRSEFAGFYCTNYLAKNTVFQIGTDICHESSEVIGNVFDNPELLGENND